MPMVKTLTTRRESALCKWPAATYVNPNQAMGDKLGTKAPDPALTPQQVATKLRRQMIDQVKAMVKASLIKKQRESASVAAVAVSLVVTEVSVHEELARMEVDVQGAMRALEGSPLYGAPTGDVGFLADAIIQWGVMEPGKRIKDYKISAPEYIKLGT